MITLGGEALDGFADGCAAQGEGGSWAIVLPGSDGTAALIELGAPALQAPPGALEALFAAVGRLVCAATMAPESPQRDILTREDAACAMPLQAPRGSCRTQYRQSDHSPDPLPASAVSDLQSRTSAPAVLDAQALARLRELDPKGENKLVDRVLRAFETSALRLLPQLGTARAGGDRAGGGAGSYLSRSRRVIGSLPRRGAQRPRRALDRIGPPAALRRGRAHGASGGVRIGTTPATGACK